MPLASAAAMVFALLERAQHLLQHLHLQQRKQPRLQQQQHRQPQQLQLQQPVH